MIASANVAPIDDPTPESDSLTCPGCDAIGDAPCAQWCAYADAFAEAATMADTWLDEAREDAA